MHAYLQIGYPRDPIWTEHQAIADAICVGDGPLAEKLARDHGRNARERLVARME
jgi:DNA-binding FadR family transcriptional regulator